jgi:hypothetical protein
LVLVSACKQLQENQAVAWILKTKEKNPPKQESLVFLETTVHRVGETAENQQKTREKSKVAENQMFWLDFCAKKKDCAYPLGFGRSFFSSKLKIEIGIKFFSLSRIRGATNYSYFFYEK